MAVGDDMSEGSVSSLVLDSLDSNQSGEVLSPEDLAWADSCLIKDPEISDSNWNSLKDALLEIISSHDSLDSSAAGSDGLPRGTDIEILPSSEEAEIAQLAGRTDDYIVLINEAAEESSDDSLINENTDTFWSRTNLENAFLPNYHDDMKESENIDLGLDLGFSHAFLPNYHDDVKESENIDLGLDLGFSPYEMEASTEDIFKVWDLDVPAEEDELVKQLNKALAGGSFRSILTTFGDAGARKDSNEELLDDIISGIADLSLSQTSG